MAPEGAVLAREVFVGRRARVNCFWDSFGVWIGVALFWGAWRMCLHAAFAPSAFSVHAPVVRKRVRV